MTSPEVKQALRRAHAAAQIGKHHHVIERGRECVAREPACVEAWELLVWAHVELRQYEAAMEAALRGLRWHAESSRLHYSFAIALHRTQRLQQAQSHIDLACALEPSNAVYLARAARIALARGGHSLACELASRSLSIAPTDSFVLGEVTRVFCESGSVEHALRLAEQRLTAFPDDVWAKASKLFVLAHKHQPQAVVELAQEVLRVRPNLAWVWSLLAEGHSDLEQHQDATHAAEEALRLNPSTWMGGAPVARLLAANNAIAQAREVLLRSLRRRPHDAHATALLEMLNARRSKHEK